MSRRVARGRGAQADGAPAAGLAWAVGLTIAGLLLSVLVLVQLLLERVPFGDRGGAGDLRVTVVHCLLVAYLPAAFVFLRARMRRTLLDLRPALESGDPRFARMMEDVGRVRPRALLAGAAIGIGVAALGPFLSGPVGPDPWLPSTWTPEVAWHRILGPVIGVWIAWFAWTLVQESRRLSRAAALLGPLNLLDLGPLAPFTGQALVHALLTVGLLAVFGLFVVDQGVTPIMIIMTLATLVLALVSLLVPLRGVRAVIASAKSAELAWIDAGIRRHADRLREAPDTADGRLADLTAYRKLIEDVREWPFTHSTLARVALYLLIPFASWLASGLVGALIERSVFGN